MPWLRTKLRNSVIKNPWINFSFFRTAIYNTGQAQLFILQLNALTAKNAHSTYNHVLPLHLGNKGLLFMQYIWRQNFEKQDNFVLPSKTSVDADQRDQWCFKYSVHAEQFAGMWQFDILLKLQTLWYPETMQFFSRCFLTKTIHRCLLISLKNALLN